MSYCSHCGDFCPTVRDEEKGYLCCSVCGKLLDEDIYFSGPQFEKTAGGHARLAGSIVDHLRENLNESREKSLRRGDDEIQNITNYLNMGENIASNAKRIYVMAFDKNFTRGRRLSHVAAACLYLACRQLERPYLLIDFSDYLQISVYVLGAVYLQLCKLLNLLGHRVVQDLVDPSIFIHRFTERLLGQRNEQVSYTALRIIASMKRDWMQTGRKPSGLCGAALFISVLSHGLSYSKSDIVAVVHVCEATLTKRLIEFENTDSGCLTIEEFLSKADELDGVTQPILLPKPGEVLCQHKDEKTHFEFGLCEECYKSFMKISGGLEGGAEPPAFQYAEKQRKELAKIKEKIGGTDPDAEPWPNSSEMLSSKNIEKYAEASTERNSDVSGRPDYAEDQQVGALACNGTKECDNEAANDPESFSDIDDKEVDVYILADDAERQYKKIIWEKMNKEYLEEQATKEAAAAAEREAREAYLANCSDDVRSAQALAAATAAALAKSRKEKRKKREEEARNTAPATSPLEATQQMLKHKAFSSRVNYEVLGQLYTSKGGDKKQRTVSDKGDDDDDDIDENNRLEKIDKKLDPRKTDRGADQSKFEAEECSYNDNYANGDEEYAYEDFAFEEYVD